MVVISISHRGKHLLCFLFLSLLIILSLWRRVQLFGMVRSFAFDSSFRTFIRIIGALPFLPINRLEAVLDILKEEKFDKNSEYHAKNIEFRDKFIAYFEQTWIRGHFPPEVWNHYTRPANITNNLSESYNSRMAKVVKSIHPNAHILAQHCCNELLRDERLQLSVMVIIHLIYLIFLQPHNMNTS